MIVDKGILGDRKSVAMTTAAQQFSNFGDDSRKKTRIPESKVQGTPRSKSKFVCLVSIFCFMLSTVKERVFMQTLKIEAIHTVIILKEFL